MVFWLIALAAAVPEVPLAVATIAEGNEIVLRSFPGEMPLYSFDKDEPGKSNCIAACATAWPPLAAPAGAKPVGKWTVIARPDGARQWAYDGRPVYTFGRDTSGKATGDGMGGVWHLLPTSPTK